ncbi:MAG TPA: Holliday junction resolvase RuvX [Chloroflexota bacterium]|nr:Holliday junction resolvase RuvX [Chloroflexota bacterium]
MPVALGLDVGERRIGVAKSDPTGLLATPLTTVVRESDRQAVAAIAELVRQHEVEALVVGLPLGPQGEATDQSERIAAFGRRLRSIPGSRVVFSDERFTTQTAEESLRMVRARRGAPSARRREAERRHIDAAAAAVILQDYLDQQRSSDPSRSSEPRRPQG